MLSIDSGVIMVDMTKKLQYIRLKQIYRLRDIKFSGAVFKHVNFASFL